VVVVPRAGQQGRRGVGHSLTRGGGHNPAVHAALAVEYVVDNAVGEDDTVGTAVGSALEQLAHGTAAAAVQFRQCWSSFHLHPARLQLSSLCGLEGTASVLYLFLTLPAYDQVKG
jgi:hypothetical protein